MSICPKRNIQGCPKVWNITNIGSTNNLKKFCSDPSISILNSRFLIIQGVTIFFFRLLIQPIFIIFQTFGHFCISELYLNQFEVPKVTIYRFKSFKLLQVSSDNYIHYLIIKHRFLCSNFILNQSYYWLRILLYYTTSVCPVPIFYNKI